MRIRIATRKSALALWQAEHVAAKLRQLDAVTEVVLVPLSTRGDEILDRSLQKVGGKGLFIKELEVAMQSGEADIAVHSMKDVPAEMPAGFCIAAVLERADPADALVGRTLTGIPRGGKVGSSSLRRAAQLLMQRPDLRIVSLRGNVNTRLEKLDRGDYDAIVLAAAGLERLGFSDRISEKLTPDQMLPAAAQGVVGIECRSDNETLCGLLDALSHRTTLLRTTAERAIARALDASCQSPVASFAIINGDTLTLSALVAMPDGSRAIRETSSGPASDAAAIGESLAERLLQQGADDILLQCEAEHG